MLHADEKTKFYLDSLNKARIEPLVSTDEVFDMDDAGVAITVDDSFVQQALSHSAAHVQKRLINNTKCEDCLNELFDRSSSSLEVHPDILRVCKKAELELKIVTNGKENCNLGKYYDLLMSHILYRITNDVPNAFSGLSEHIMDQSAINNHRNLLLKLCVDLFLKARMEQYAKQFNVSRESMRKKLTKLILFRNE